MIYFTDRMVKKGPKYLDCNERQTSCDTRLNKRTAQPRKGCPNCEYTIQYKIMTQELERELRQIPRGTWAGYSKWPAKYLVQVVAEAAGLAASSKGTSPNWTTQTAMLVSLYRNEKDKKRFIDTYQPEEAPDLSQGPLLKDE